MKRILISLLLAAFLLCGLNAEGRTQERVVLKDNVSGLPLPVRLFYSPGFPDLCRDAADQRSHQDYMRRLLPCFLRSPFRDASDNTRSESTDDLKVSGSVDNSEILVIKLEGPDIIHPFDYFW